jgi:hypothetical protein
MPRVSVVAGDDATKQAAVFGLLLLASTAQGLSDPNVRPTAPPLWGSIG